MVLGFVGCVEIAVVVFLLVCPSSQHHPVSDTILVTDTSMQLTSTMFKSNGSIPSLYTCEGANTNPPLTITDVPADAKSLALIMDDPDVPLEVRPDGIFDHWVLYNIPTTTTLIPANGYVGSLGVNSGGGASYVGPCPPTQYAPREHRYQFTLYAVDYVLQFQTPPTKAEVLKALQGHTLAQVTLVGRYQKKGR